MRFKSIRQIKNLRGKRVLLRVDFNVPLNKSHAVADDTKIRLELPTIEYLVKRGAEIILLSHLGRPNGKVVPALTMQPVTKQLEVLLGHKIPQAKTWDFKKLKHEIDELEPGEIIMLQNVRFLAEEEKNDPSFSKFLTGLGDIFINDAFAASHRNHASTVGITKFLPSFAGFLLEKEFTILTQLLQKPKRPFIALLGGAKISDKIGVIKNLSKKADAILLGGALINNFYKAMGYEIGDSLVEEEGVKLAKKLLTSKKILLPMDVVVGTRDGKGARVVEINPKSPCLPAGRQFLIYSKKEAILDIGPKTILEYAKHIKKARTLLWNGPLGMFELKPFHHGTLALGRLFAARSKGLAYGVAGGGETIEALKQTGMIEYVDWVSTGGGAMLEFLSDKTLPALKPLFK